MVAERKASERAREYLESVAKLVQLIDQDLKRDPQKQDACCAHDDDDDDDRPVVNGFDLIVVASVASLRLACKPLCRLRRCCCCRTATRHDPLRAAMNE